MIQFGGFFILAAIGISALLILAVVIAGSFGGRGVGAGFAALFRNWNHLSDNLEEQVLALDFFRLEDGYDSTKPLVLCKDGGLMALYEMSGLDPEPISEQELTFASNAIRRGVEAAPKPAGVFKGIAAKGWEDLNRAIDARGADWMKQRFLRVRVGAWLALFVWLAPSFLLVGWGVKTFVQVPLSVMSDVRAQRREEKAKKAAQRAMRPVPAAPGGREGGGR